MFLLLAMKYILCSHLLLYTTLFHDQILIFFDLDKYGHDNDICSLPLHQTIQELKELENNVRV